MTRSLMTSAAALAFMLGAAGQAQAQQPPAGAAAGEGVTETTVCDLPDDAAVDLAAEENLALRTQLETNFELAEGQSTLGDFIISQATMANGEGGAEAEGDDGAQLAAAAADLCTAAGGEVVTIGDPGALEGSTVMTLTTRQGGAD